jgi:hypothetical protein
MVARAWSESSSSLAGRDLYYLAPTFSQIGGWGVTGLKFQKDHFAGRRNGRTERPFGIAQGRLCEDRRKASSFRRVAETSTQVACAPQIRRSETAATELQIIAALRPLPH